MILLSKRREVIVIAHKRVDVIGDGKPWKPASQDDLNRDKVGFTNPNLHQRLDVKPPQKPELFPREYSEAIQGYIYFAQLQNITMMKKTILMKFHKGRIV